MSRLSVQLGTWITACFKKRKYKFVRDAEQKLRERGDSKGRIYSCRYCGYWHIGHLKYDKRVIAEMESSQGGS